MTQWGRAGWLAPYLTYRKVNAKALELIPGMRPFLSPEPKWYNLGMVEVRCSRHSRHLWLYPWSECHSSAKAKGVTLCRPSPSALDSTNTRTDQPGLPGLRLHRPGESEWHPLSLQVLRA